jgi:hypothetical protein
MDLKTDVRLNKGFDHLGVIIDTYTKMADLIPVKKKNTTAEDLATIFVREIRRLHGIPAHMISDRDSRLISKF